MKKILSVFLCLIFICSIVSCDTKESPSGNEKVEENITYTFISEQERLSWKDKIVTAISTNGFYDDYKVLQSSFIGMALMDLNFDNTPELIAAYTGGSMGNVCIVVYDLESGEHLCLLGDTPHYKNWDNVYFCVYRDHEGNYLIVNEGALRSGLEWYTITSSLNNQFEFDTLFAKVEISGDDSRYYCGKNEVDKAAFEKQKEQFENNYKAVAETQLKMIHWDTIVPNGKGEPQNEAEIISEMADKLVNSDQQFIRFDISTQQSTTDYKQAYPEFLKAKKDSNDLFALVYIDNDDIPELYLCGMSEAEGDMINQNDHMGLYYDNVYKLTENDFSQILDSKYTKRY